MCIMKRVDKIFEQLRAQQSVTDATSQEHVAELDKRIYTTLTPVKTDYFFPDELSSGPSLQIDSLKSRLNDVTDNVLPCKSVLQNSRTSDLDHFDLPVSSNLRSAEITSDVEDFDDPCFTNQGNSISNQYPDVPGPSNRLLVGYDSDVENSDDSLKDKDYKPENDNSDSTTSEENVQDEGFRSEPLQETSLKKTRWSTARPSTWKRNIEKKKKRQGQPYKSVSGKIQTPKVPKPVDCSKCRYKCTTHFSEDERKVLCQTFWNLEYLRQKDFLIMNILSKEVKHRRPRKGDESKQRSNAKSYFFNKKEAKHQVCQSFFCKTLCISNIPILNAFQNRSETGEYSGTDKRGRKAPANKTPEDVIIRVKKHIDSFPVVESHYSRKSSKRLYLDPNLNIKKMFDLFMEECKEQQLPGVSLITYRRIFCTQYNLSFFKPKKDQCSTCNEYQQAADKEKLELKFQEHMRRKDESMKEKDEDKKKATGNKSFKSVTCDMQSVLQIPTSQVSLLYYLRKLNLFNFTIYESAPPNEAFCYFWTEINGKRGSCEIGTCLSLYLNSLSPEVKHITIFSDTCGGQNRNVQITALLLHIVRIHPTLCVIEQKFMESGHSYMEVDSMHSSIETAKRHIDIYSVHEYENVFKMARAGRKRNTPPYKTRELQFNEFLDLKKLVQLTIDNKNIDEGGNNVNWLKVKCFKYDKQFPNIVHYNYAFSDDYKQINIGYTRRASNRKTKDRNFEDISIPPLYNRQLAISVAKKKDLLKLCDKNIIPPTLHDWYKNLPCSSSVSDVTPEPAEDDTDEES